MMRGFGFANSDVNNIKRVDLLETGPNECGEATNV